jgi:formamidopyrimidine-DNA glycosylase
MWGAVELYPEGEELKRDYIRDMRPTPIDAEFTLEYFLELIDQVSGQKKQSAKGLLTQDQAIPGLGNSIAQDILFQAGIHPKQDLSQLGESQKEKFYKTIRSTVEDIIQAGGRYDEYDLFGEKGGYVRLMDKNALEKPCPACGGEIQKIQYLGGSCYLCPTCQVLS